MAKLKTAEKAIVLGGILEKFDYKVDIKHDAEKIKYFVECPDFVFMLGIHGQQDGYAVHVMADAAIAIYVMETVNRSVPGLVGYGPFARDPDAGGRFAQGERALEIKESLIMYVANQIIQKRLQAEKNKDAIEGEVKTVATEPIPVGIVGADGNVIRDKAVTADERGSIIIAA